MAHPKEQHEAWIGRVLSDAWGHKIGKVDDIYIDDDTGLPEWLAVTTGLMGANTHLVPMRGATVSGRGVQVPFPKDRVKAVPGLGAEGRLSRMEKGRLYAHYGYTYAEEQNRLQLSLGFDLPAPSEPVVLQLGSGPSEPSEVRRPTTSSAEAEPRPRGRGDGRGRWPDDEAIFGLTQEAGHPTLAASGASRPR